MLDKQYAILTIVRGRRTHINNLLKGVCALIHPPAEVIVVYMNEEPPGDLPSPNCQFLTAAYYDPDHALPLAAARNRAAAMAQTDYLLFLDVDCIPDPNYATEMLSVLIDRGGLVMGEVRYLPDALSTDWSYPQLVREGLPHPRRPNLQPNETLSTEDYHLFWSLSFAVTRSDFATIGGFDEAYVGYGGEDTDFAFSARAAGIPFTLSGARCYHQHHPTCTPPYNHLADIVTNARAFRAKWGYWPMEGWLDAFAASGHLRRTPTELEIVRLPSQAEIAQARSDSPFA